MDTKEKMINELSKYYKGKRVIITGSNGFVGSAIKSKLSHFGAYIFGVDIKNGVDIRDLELMKDIFRDVSPDIVLHLAAEVEVGKSFKTPHPAYSTNVYGTLNILEMARQNRGNLKSLVIASTDKVYGVAPPPYVEDHEMMWCTNPYAASKQYADKIAQDYARFYGLPIRILRCVNTYGPGQLNETTLITGSIMRILRGERAIIHNSDHEREWLYIDDAVLAYLMVGYIRDDESRVYNVGTGETLCPSEVIRHIISLMGGDYSFVPAPAISDMNHRVDSIDFRHEFKAWSPTKFTDGLQETVKWYKENFKTITEKGVTKV